MLSASDQRWITSHFWAYEHEWSFLRGYLGEPFLIDDYILFCDGTTVNICAFALNDRARMASEGDVENLVSGLQLWKSPALVHVWGLFDVPETITLRDGTSLMLGNRIAREEVYPGEYTLDLATHNIESLSGAREAARSARVKSLSTQVRRLRQLETRHFELIESWCETRAIASMAACAAASLAAYVRESHVMVIEVLDHNVCRGFSVLASSTSNDAVLLLSFPEKYPGARIGDSLLQGAIAHCKQGGYRHLHMGYAGSDSIAQFKRKWGGQETVTGTPSTGPRYRQAVYAESELWLERAARLDFYWMSRLLTLAAER